jgi:hypothetical protein
MDSSLAHLACVTTVRRLNLKLRFQVLTAASMKMTVFWDVALYSLVEVYRRFRGAYSIIALISDDDSI